MILEVCVDNVESAIIAEKGGASRIELCSSLELGGLTPTIGLLIEVNKHVPNIPIFCMLRPRSGDFCYSQYEIDQMKSDAEKLKECNADGFVFGCLDSQQMIDQEACLQIISTVHGFPCTFHRAFDFISGTENVGNRLKIVEDLGFSRVLTTGGGPNVTASMDNLKTMFEHCRSMEIKILPGGGVNSNNVCLLKEIGFEEVHSSCSDYQDDALYGAIFNNHLPVGKRKLVSQTKVENVLFLIDLGI